LTSAIFSEIWPACKENSPQEPITVFAMTLAQTIDGEQLPAKLSYRLSVRKKRSEQLAQWSDTDAAQAHPIIKFNSNCLSER